MSTSTEKRSILVWDLPVRMFHWLLVLSFFGAYLSAESERWKLVHVTLGYTVAGLVAFRLVWGLVGTRHARFSDFVRGPATVLRYLRGLLGGRPDHHVGHNPAGAVSIVALIALAVIAASTGWATYNELGGDWLGEVHEVAANLMMGIVFLHVLAVLASSWLHRENLVRAMVTGRKAGAPEDGIGRAWRPLGALMLAAVLAFWGWQWTSAPSPAPGDGTLAADSGGHDHGHERARGRAHDDD
jgi:cytochrome b